MHMYKMYKNINYLLLLLQLVAKKYEKILNLKNINKIKFIYLKKFVHF